ncbi:MAG: NAD(+) synthase [Clostridia bacterium]|nr:NAD(+) synthase [Clostridia bacterium]
MKDGFVRVGAVSPALFLTRPEKNCDELIKEATRADNLGIKLLTFPELALSGATAGDMLFHRTLLVACERELERFMESTASLDVVCVVGLPALIGNKIYNVAAVVSRGVLLGIVAKSVLRADEKRYFASAPSENIEVSFAGYDTLLGSDILFASESVPSLTFAVAVGSEVASPIAPHRYHAVSGATLIANPSSVPETVTSSLCEESRILADSSSLVCAIVSATSSEGESGTDAVYAGRCYLAECGKMLAECGAFSDDTLTYSECDFDAILAKRLKNPDFECTDAQNYDYIAFELDTCEYELTRKIEKSPFIPEDAAELARRLDVMNDIQAHALAGRINRSFSKGVVVGISGGLDSTLALLVGARAVELAGLSPSALIAVTMPGFGTTSRTKSNAERLSEALGADLRCIDIKAAVEQHFKDIGHSAEDYSVVYENAQARERTQILMDVANAEGALVVGTGDLSELALGWATYNGDHMSMYGVNAGVPKTLMRHAVSAIADKYEREGKREVEKILRDVLATPVSPELLPPKDGEIAQCTEGIVGPYELHDFFLYYLVHYGFSPDKIARLANAAFAGEYDSATIEGWLCVFVKRFFAQQFKRSCLPDGPMIGSVSFSPRGSFKMPSDASSAEWLSRLSE